MNRVREPVAAGSFYPLLPAALERVVDVLLGDASRTKLPGRLRALVVPHDAYLYSGAVAAGAFVSLPREGVRAVLLGPSHFAPLRGAAVSTAEAWRTPLGLVRVDAGLREAALAAGATEDDDPHRDDHALEVELPFLQRWVVGRLSILPVAVGHVRQDEALRLLSALDHRALLVVSSDLSHYHDEETTRRLDDRTVTAVLALEDQAIGESAACGIDALRPLVRHARQRGWVPTLLDLRTSAEATGDESHVAGYGAFAFTEAGFH